MNFVGDDDFLMMVDVEDVPSMSSEYIISLHCVCEAKRIYICFISAFIDLYIYVYLLLFIIIIKRGVYIVCAGVFLNHISEGWLYYTANVIINEYLYLLYGVIIKYCPL